MNVLQILTELGPGGAEKVALDLTGELLQRGHSVSVIALKAPPENKTIVDAFLAQGVVPEFLRMEGVRDLARLLTLRRRIRELNPDVVHSHLMHSNLLSRLACFGLHKRLLNTVHISERRPGMTGYFLMDRLTFPLCSACNAVSFASAAFHEEKLGLKKGTISVIYNGVDEVPDPGAELLAARKREWGVADCSRLIGAIGRLNRQKGFDQLAGILPSLSRRIPPGESWGLVILGEGPERSALETLFRSAPPNIRVCMPGFQSDASAMTWMFDSFVMPSRYEGYGLVLAEAMTTGVPVVVNPVDSLPELCRFYTNSIMSDFSNINQADETAAAIWDSARRGRTTPQIISSKKEMANRYLSLYAGF